RAIRHGLALALLGSVALTIADVAMRNTLGRGFILFFDLPLAGSLIELTRGAVGDAIASIAILGIVVAVGVAYVLIVGCLRVAQAALRQSPGGRAAVLLSCAALSAAHIGGWDRAALATRLISGRAPQLLAAQAGAAAALVTERATFREGGAVPFSPTALAQRLGGADVLVFFVESYGRSSIEDPPYAATIVPALRRLGRSLAGHGLSAASGWLVSPTLGGQSWLAHSTLLSGLRIDNQLRYGLLLSGDRATLVDDFNAAGYRTVLVAPAINRPWPEVAFYGFDRTYFSWDMGYAGPAFSWVTMPDQYTLHVLDRAERRAGAAPLLAVAALISSHAPWTPVPEVVEDWSAIGDGRIFAALPGRGGPPEVVWRDREGIRRQYSLSIAYVIGVLEAYFARPNARATLSILVGDHQPGPIISGRDASRDVPIHVIGSDPDLLAPFREWGLVEGMLPAAGGGSEPMEAFRGWFLGAFGPASAAPGAGTTGGPSAGIARGRQPEREQTAAH
ncbi:MAG TPA: hypothetical protein VE270_02575, partial [Thermoleophilaceae bacterium]|nr:hypothetical protein [Thermoleophilaceae bacterium]